MATGLPEDKKNPRLHFDIYAILEGSQELYFGHEVQVNVNSDLAPFSISPIR